MLSLLCYLAGHFKSLAKIVGSFPCILLDPRITPTIHVPHSLSDIVPSFWELQEKSTNSCSLILSGLLARKLVEMRAYLALPHYPCAFTDIVPLQAEWIAFFSINISCLIIRRYRRIFAVVAKERGKLSDAMNNLEPFSKIYYSH